HADQHLDLIGVGRMLAISMNPELNLLAATRYKSEFDAGNIYVITNEEKQKDERKHTTSKSGKAQTLFAHKVTLANFASYISRGAKIKTTLLTDEFDIAAYLAKHDGNAIPLFGIAPNGIELKVFTGERDYEKLKSDWKVMSLIIEEVNEDKRIVDKSQNF